MRQVVLPAGADAVAAFRSEARRLWAEQIDPTHIDWTTAEGMVVSSDTPPSAGSFPLTVPRAFSTLADHALLNRDPGRFSLMYQLLWRLQLEPDLRHDRLDPQWLLAERLAKAVTREQHKMRSFVRFRRVDSTAEPAGSEVQHVAWFEPDHHIVESQAPFFLARLANLRWAVLTPLRCMAWDGQQLTFAAGARRDQAPPADAGEALWLTYYAHIFNPARLKVRAMQKEMPRRYWGNLPEAALIAPLVASAHERSAAMIAQAPTDTERRWAPLPQRAEAPVVPDAVHTDEATPLQRQSQLAATCQAASACTRCPLHASATQTVFGQGPVDAPLMFVGEQPGDHEDLTGQPFSGPSGALFDRVLADLQVPRETVYVTNAVKHFKFELRGLRRIHKTAAQLEAAACIDWLEREIALVRPGAIVALGATAARALLGRPVAVLRERGQWFTRPDGRRVLVTLHPSALLRASSLESPAERDAAYDAWRDDIAPATGRELLTHTLRKSTAI